ncbi:MAG: chaperonin GroEL [Anaerolineae bacterium]
MPKPAVIHSPAAETGLLRGFNKMAGVLAVTLGPTQGTVLSQSNTGGKPEILSDSATIARRLMQLPDRAEDVGAMLLRNLVWRMHLKAGDGCATAAVLAQSILEQGHRYKVAGANPMLLQRGIKRAAAAAIEALGAMSRPVTDEDDLTRVAETVTGEPELSLILGEIFDLIGPDGYVTIEDFVAPYLERDYQEGGRFKGRLVSPYLISETATRRGVLSGGPVALYAGEVSSVEDVQPLLELAAGSDKQVTLIAHEIKGIALNMLVANHQQKRLKIIAAELRRPATPRATDFEDLAALTGATVLSPELGQRLQHITAADLGRARRVEADADSVVVLGQPAQAAVVRQQIETLQARLAGLEPDDEAAEELRFRMARLSGHVATLKLGAHTKAGRDAIRQKATKGLRSLPLALREGVAPGGGVAYLDCIPAARQVAATGEEAWGVDILARALEAPFRRIVANAGKHDPAVKLAEARRMGPGCGCDALSGETVDMADAGILDATGVLRLALETAVSGAAIALTTEALVLKRNPQQSMEP